MPRDSVEALHSASARRQQAWSIRLNTLLKSIERRATAESGVSKAESILCQLLIKKWFIPLPRIPPYWLDRMVTSSLSRSRMKVSITFDKAFVHERFRNWSKDSAVSVFGMAVWVSTRHGAGHTSCCRE